MPEPSLNIGSSSTCQVGQDIVGRMVGEYRHGVRLPLGKASPKSTVPAPGHEPFAPSIVPDHDAETRLELKRRANWPKPKRSAPNDLENPF